MLVEHARQFESISFVAPNRLVVSLKWDYGIAKDICERAENIARFEQALLQIVGRPIRVEFAVAEAAPARLESPQKSLPMRSQLQEAAGNPFVRRASELFDAQPVRVEDNLNSQRE